MYSLISILIRLFSLSNNSEAKVLAKNVFPEPEDPKNKNEPSGCYLL